MASTQDGSEGLYALLVCEHERLDGIFCQLLDALHADAREDVRQLWTHFEDDITTHMALEEKYIIEGLWHEGPEEARALLGEHDDIRRKLAELSVGVELHCVSEDVVKAFVRQLRDHARRENEHAYQWAAHFLDADVQEYLRQRLGAAESFRKNAPGLHARRQAISA